MTRAALALVLLAGCSEAVPVADAGTDSGRPWDGGGDSADASLPDRLLCDDGGFVMRRQRYSEWTGLQCRDHSQATIDADEAFWAAQARLGCCIVGCCGEEPGCHPRPEQYASATTCAELAGMQWGG